MYKTGEVGRVFNITLDLGEDILTELQKIIDAEGIQNGVIAAGLGGFNYYAMSFAQKEGQERKDKKWEDMILQLSSLQGFIEDGKLLVSSSVSIDGDKAYTYTGHLEEGSKKFFYCQMLCMEIV